MSSKKGLLFIVSGPSGSGKTTLAQNILKDNLLKKIIAKSVSFTTRPKRSRERAGRDYFFVSPEEFKRQLRKKNILEWTKYLGYYYGTPREFADKQLKSGKQIVLCVDLKGVKRLKQLYPETSVSIFIRPPSLKELRRRIKNRCQKVLPEEINLRLEEAKKEMLAADKFDYRIVNKDLNKATKDLKEIILKRGKHGIRSA